MNLPEEMNQRIEKSWSALKGGHKIAAVVATIIICVIIVRYLPIASSAMLGSALVVAAVVVIAYGAWRMNHDAGARNPVAVELSEDHRRSRRIGLRISILTSMTFAVLLLAVATLSALLAPFPVNVSIFVLVAGLCVYTAVNAASQLRVERIENPESRLIARSEHAERTQRQLFWLAIGAIGYLVMVFVGSRAFGLNLFGASLFSLSPGVLPTAATIGGVVMTSVGIHGRWVAAPVHCRFCFYPVDQSTNTGRCPECGRDFGTDDVVSWRRVRAPRLVVLGSLCALFGVSVFVANSNPAFMSAAAARLSTRALISEIHFGGIGNGERIAWAELQSRMPLTPNEEAALVDAAVKRVMNGDTFLFPSLPGFDVWLTTAWPRSTNYAETVRALRVHIETSIVDGGVGDNRVWAEAELLYHIDGTLAPASERDRLIELALRIAAAPQPELTDGIGPYSQWEWIGMIGNVRTWLEGCEQAGILNDSQQTQWSAIKARGPVLIDLSK